MNDEVLSRVDKLTPDSKANWGKMNVNQALRHMSMAFDVPVGKLDPTPFKVPPMPKWLLKFFLLNVKPPKAKVETFVEMNTVTNKINPSGFEAERNFTKPLLLTTARSPFIILIIKTGTKFSFLFL